jgi:hypothetical protein
MMMVLFGRSWAPASGSILTLWGGRPKEGGVFREREKKYQNDRPFFSYFSC